MEFRVVCDCRGTCRGLAGAEGEGQTEFSSQRPVWRSGSRGGRAADKCAPIPRERERLMREPGMTDNRAVTTASQGAREAQLIKGQKKVYARQGRAY